MEAQALFNQVISHLRTQGKKALSGIKFDDADNPSCMYRTPDGCRCAAGCLISDDEYRESWEGTTIHTLINQPDKYRSHSLARLVPHQTLVSALQRCHDNYEVEEWEGRFGEIAREFDLVLVPLTAA